ncbi:hypothetical protein ACQEVZ_44975 [Dactylosporangium sp. CA-152071]|uniref:hypothetical protein n=1 Tax=Dactylosporangium sp. CA-152071 TaxID=3239933 RepID=UPI003D909D9E
MAWSVLSTVGDPGDQEIDSFLLLVKEDTAAARQDGDAVQGTPDDFGEQLATVSAFPLAALADGGHDHTLATLDILPQATYWRYEI